MSGHDGVLSSLWVCRRCAGRQLGLESWWSVGAGRCGAAVPNAGSPHPHHEDMFVGVLAANLTAAFSVESN
jgi:hypothetical protein